LLKGLSWSWNICTVTCGSMKQFVKLVMSNLVYSLVWVSKNIRLVCVSKNVLFQFSHAEFVTCSESNRCSQQYSTEKSKISVMMIWELNYILCKNIIFIQKLKNTFMCGRKFLGKGRIYGGSYTKARQHPWYVFYELYNPMFQRHSYCGAVLIDDPERSDSSRYLLTAGHCVDE